MAKTKSCAALMAAGIPLLLAAGSAVAGSSQGIIQCNGRPASAGIQDDSRSAPAGIQDDSHPAPAGIQDDSRPAAKPAPKPLGGDAAIQDNSRSHHLKHTHLRSAPPAAGPTNTTGAKAGGG